MTETYSQELFIEASPDHVFEHFLVPELLVQWMGDFARLEPKPGGLFSVDINGVLIRGRYVRIERPTLLEISWGEPGNQSMPPEATRLVITLRSEKGGTVLSLVHSGLVPDEAKKHAIGWPHFLSRLHALSKGESPGRDPWAKITP